MAKSKQWQGDAGEVDNPYAGSVSPFSPGDILLPPGCVCLLTAVGGRLCFVVVLIGVGLPADLLQQPLPRGIFSFVDHGAVPGQLVCAKPNDGDEHQAEQGVESEQGDHRKADNACQGKGE